MVDKKRNFQALASHLTAKLLAGMKPSFAVDILPEPVQQAGSIASGDILLQRRHILFRLCIELRGIEAPQAIGREIAKAAMAPVYILQAAPFIIRHCHTQLLEVLFIPVGRNFRGFQRTFYQLLFQPTFFNKAFEYDLY